MNKLNLRKNYKLLALFLSVLLVSACEDGELMTTYIKTDRGLMSFASGYCVLGMLTNNDRVNILDEDRIPITCAGYVNLTRAQKNEYEAAY